MGSKRGVRTETTPERIATFLEELAAVGLITDAAVAAGFCREWIWHLRQMSPCFDEQVERAIAHAKTDGRIIESLRRGAMGMDEEVVVYQGEVVMTWYDDTGAVRGVLPSGMNATKARAQGWQYAPLVRRTRDTKAATFLLAAMDPDRYGRQRIEHTGKNGGPVETKNVLVVPDPGAVREWGSGDIVDEVDEPGDDE